MVIKRGNTTGLTVGRANGLRSFTRHDGSNEKVSREWAVLPFDSKSDPFSAESDSGSVIVDGIGHVGGLLTGGTHGSYHQQCRQVVLLGHNLRHAHPLPPRAHKERTTP